MQVDVESNKSVSASSIATWLDTHPDDPAQYIFEDKLWINESSLKSSDQSTVKKRKAVYPTPTPLSTTQNLRFNRGRLAPTSGNTISRPTRYRKVDAKEEDDLTEASELLYNQVQSSISFPERGQHSKAADKQDVKQTPTRRSQRALPSQHAQIIFTPSLQPDPSRSPTAHPPKNPQAPKAKQVSKKLNRSPPKFQIPADQRTVPSSKADLASMEQGDPSESLSASRLPSSARSAPDLELADIPVCYVQIYDAPGLCLAEEALELLSHIDSVGDGRAIVPEALRGQVIQCLVEQRRKTKEAATNMFAGCRSVAPAGDNGDHAFVFRSVVTLAKAARKSYTINASEAHWNGAVHHPLIALALDSGGWEDNGIMIVNVTAARIAEKRYLPTQALNKKANPSKLVDYAIAIDGLDKSIYNRLRQSGIYSINHSDAKYLRYKPTSISIETKRANIGEDDAKLQLGTWVHAHYAKLADLVRGPADAPMPSLPLLMVQGHEWKLMIAEKAGLMIYIHGDVNIGDTRSVLGIYQIIGVFWCLARWTKEVYQPWFVKNVL
ncbi:MAG: hypothetical protein Q9163_005530 [Psora crenata]